MPFFWRLVLGLLAGLAKSLAGLQRTYHELTGAVLASSSFLERICSAMIT